MKYTALTIGPINLSLMQAQKVKEIWAASFMLSKLMEYTIGYLIDDYKVQEDQFIVPNPNVRNHNKYTTELDKAGVYPDRLILKSETGLFDQLQNHVSC